MHIIVCSNSRSVVDASALAFESRQPRLTVCESGLEVLGAVQVVDADLLIMDTQTPGLDGLFIVSAIRELAPNLPILAVSAKPEDDARVFSHKGVSFARLPADPESSVEALVAALAHVGQVTVPGIAPMSARPDPVPGSRGARRACPEDAGKAL